MNILERIKNKRKGAFTSVVFRSTNKPSAQFKGVNLEKITTCVVRLGIQYANLSSVKVAIENGERGEVGSLPWGNWVEGYENLLISHKDSLYVRFYSAPNDVHTKYLVDGKEVSKETYKGYLTPSDAKRTSSDTMTVKLDNIIEVK